MNKQWPFIFLLLLSITLFGCHDAAKESQADSDENEQLSFSLDWTPNTNHTGIYVAKEKGYYDEAGINLDILLPGEVKAEQLVAAGRADFGISFQAEVSQARAEDLPIVSIAAIIQNNTGGYASPLDHDIESPEDFAGKVYGSTGSNLDGPMMDLVMKRDDADGADVEVVQLGKSDFFAATKKEVDFVNIFYGWTGIEAELKGMDLNFVKTADYAEELNTYTPVIIASEGMVNDQPEKAQAFMNATAKGYEFAINHPEEAADILIDAEPDLDPELVKRSQEWLSSRYQDDAAIWGIQETKRWVDFADFLSENDIISQEINAEEAFTNDFIEDGSRD